MTTRIKAAVTMSITMFYLSLLSFVKLEVEHMLPTSAFSIYKVTIGLSCAHF